jgi:hypothetical protein
MHPFSGKVWWLYRDSVRASKSIRPEGQAQIKTKRKCSLPLLMIFSFHFFATIFLSYISSAAHQLYILCSFHRQISSTIIPSSNYPTPATTLQTNNMPFEPSKLSRVTLQRNANYKRDGRKSYAALLHKCEFDMTLLR